MAPRPERRRRDADPPDTNSEAGGDSALTSAEHAWWAQRDIDEPWSPPRPPEAQDGPERDILAEHFGADWRTSFDLHPRDDAAPDAEPAPEPGPEPPLDTTDPYAVLAVDPSASWEAIVEAHRAQARRHHPDRLFGRPEAEILAAEERIRDINVAYQELRVRRGR